MFHYRYTQVDSFCHAVHGTYTQALCMQFPLINTMDWFLKIFKKATKVFLKTVSLSCPDFLPNQLGFHRTRCKHSLTFLIPLLLWQSHLEKPVFLKLTLWTFLQLREWTVTRDIQLIADITCILWSHISSGFLVLPVNNCSSYFSE